MLENFTIIETILRDRNYFFTAIRDCEDLWPKIQAMLISCTAFFAIYGAVMGASHSLLQAIVSFFKLPALFILTLAICTPALYFFNLLFGSKQRLSQSISLILTAMTTTSVLLVSFAPVTFFFLITTSHYQFFKVINVFFFAVAGALGVVFLREGMIATTDLHNMEGIEARRIIFFLWILLYTFVGTQMAWTLSPFMGDPNLPFLLFTQPGGNFYSDIITSLRQLLGR
ncbi:MAG: actin-binding WH2 domain-containing protein [Chloroflexota bacterium]